VCTAGCTWLSVHRALSTCVHGWMYVAQRAQSFEYLCARLDVRGSACTVLLVYRPASVVSVITSIADQMVPPKTVTCRHRASDPWFDDECRTARKNCRRLERQSHRSLAVMDRWRTKLRSYRRLTRRKHADFWHISIEGQKTSPRRLWRSIDQLMGREKQAASPDITASVFYKHFVDKIWGVCASTDGAADPVFRPGQDGSKLDVFQPVDVDEITSLIASLPNKQCSSSDPIPT